MTAPPRPPRLRSVPNTSDAPPPEVHFIEPGRHHSVPPIRVEAYHGIIGDYVSTIAPTTESDPVAVLVQCLSWAGCRLGRSVYLRHGTTQHYPMVWPLIIGKTSVARKGTSEADSINPLTAIDGIPRRRNGMTSGEGVIDAFLPSGGPDEPPPDPRMLVVESEWESVLARCRREGNTLSAVLRDAYDHRPLATMNAGGGGRLADQYSLAVIGHITPRAFREGMTSKDLSNGFLNRFLVLLVHRPHMVPWPGVASGEAERLIDDIVVRAKTAATGEMELSEEARGTYIDWYKRREANAEDLHERVAMATARGVPNLLRISMVFAALDGGLVIDTSHLEAAMAIVDNSHASAHRLLAPGRTGLDAQILDKLKNGQLSRTQLSNAFHRHVTAEQLDEAIAPLMDAGLMERATEPTAGRPVDYYRITHLGRKHLDEQL